MPFIGLDVIVVMLGLQGVVASTFNDHLLRYRDEFFQILLEKGPRRIEIRVNHSLIYNLIFSHIHTTLSHNLLLILNIHRLEFWCDFV